jgi:hypothetical protein
MLGLIHPHGTGLRDLQAVVEYEEDQTDDDKFPKYLFSRGRHRHCARGGHP